MKENFSNESKNKWTRIFKKKWFFPALYIVLAAFLLTAVVWYQNIENKLIEGLDEKEQTDEYDASSFNEDAQSVLQQEETIKMPVSEEVQAEIVTKFYDYNADQEEQEKGVTLYNNRYYQSTGVNIASNDGETFDVIASLSGTVTAVQEDPLLGNVVIMSHGDDITTYYAGLGEIEVETGAKIKQGDKISTAVENLFSEESGVHVHFEIRKGDTEVNPENFFNEALSKLVQFDVDVKEENSRKEEQTERPDAEDADNKKDEQEDAGTKKEEQDEDASEERQNLSFSVTV